MFGVLKNVIVVHVSSAHRPFICVILLDCIFVYECLKYLPLSGCFGDVWCVEGCDCCSCSERASPVHMCIYNTLFLNCFIVLCYYYILLYIGI